MLSNEISVAWLTTMMMATNFCCKINLLTERLICPRWNVWTESLKTISLENGWLRRFSDYTFILLKPESIESRVTKNVVLFKMTESRADKK